ncbi:hypothetical protein MMC25_007289 [Agyrium rufum]|nr:hypothetical protein [Agyrium rufum]
MFSPNFRQIWQKGVYHPARQSEDEEFDDAEKSEATFPQQRQHPTSRTLYLWTAIAFGYSFLITVSLVHHILSSKHEGPKLIYTPARDAMKYELVSAIQSFPNKYHEDPYFGDPTVELDLRWAERLKYASIRLTADEFKHYNQSGILLGDDSGYLATPTVYHDLHCIRHLHKLVYPDRYFSTGSEKNPQYRDAHTRHCLHNLAHSLTCNADMTIRVMKWNPNVLLPSPVDHEHECMNWDRIEAWAKERSVDTAAPGLLVHPTRGEVFPGGVYKGDDH